MQEERVKRAEKYAEYMRNWMAICTLVVTVVFVAFGVLGLKSYADLENFRNQVKTNADEVSGKTRDVETAAQKIGQIMGDLPTQGCQRSEASAGTREAKMLPRCKQMTDTLRGDVKRTSVVAQQARVDTSNLQYNFANLAGADPIVFSAPLIIDERFISSLEGKNFGSSPGHLYATVQLGLPTSMPIEIQRSSIRTWNDTEITFALSATDMSALEKARDDLQRPAASASQLGIAPTSSQLTFGPFVAFKVVNSQGKSSGWSSTYHVSAHSTAVTRIADECSRPGPCRRSELQRKRQKRRVEMALVCGASQPETRAQPDRGAGQGGPAKRARQGQAARAPRKDRGCRQDRPASRTGRILAQNCETDGVFGQDGSPGGAKSHLWGILPHYGQKP